MQINAAWVGIDGQIFTISVMAVTALGAGIAGAFLGIRQVLR